MSAVPSPPADLRAPNTSTLPAGSRLHRIHDSRFGGAAFNPCLGRPTRFAPIVDAQGRCVPSLYAATSREAAIFETVFHDVPIAAPFKTVRLADVLTRSHSLLATRRPLVLAELRAPDLVKWGMSHRELVSAPASEYERTALWAKALHDHFPRLDGLAWTSNRCDPDSAMLLFGDRVETQALECLATTEAGDEVVLAAVREAGLRAGIVLTV
ncbi:RES family NAD+ phosphorylase [Salinarimonas sp. NSM]|uniref:RES family NAD+ phosphorylase n=1 Tax=Salinarimonas sp. NSM TaxID=3458003 RepID=UPI0040368DE6